MGLLDRTNTPQAVKAAPGTRYGMARATGNLKATDGTSTVLWTLDLGTQGLSYEHGRAALVGNRVQVT